MRIRQIGFLILFSLPAFGQTVDLGQHAFYNNEGEIVMGIDASVVAQKLDSPYIMFVAYIGANGNKSFEVNRNDVIMIYKEMSYPMPSLKELRENYRGEMNDTTLSLRMGKEAILLSQLRFYRYRWQEDFFPDPRAGQLAIDRGSVAGNIGFKTRLYFKNPGLKKGDQIVIAVREKESSRLIGYCAVNL